MPPADKKKCGSRMICERSRKMGHRRPYGVKQHFVGGANGKLKIPVSIERKTSQGKPLRGAKRVLDRLSALCRRVTKGCKASLCIANLPKKIWRKLAVTCEKISLHNNMVSSTVCKILREDMDGGL